MDITNSEIKGKRGFGIEWILKENLNDIGEVDHDRTEYGFSVFDNFEEAKSMLIKNANNAPCDWGTLSEYEFIFIEGFPYAWERLSDTPDYYVEEFTETPSS